MLYQQVAERLAKVIQSGAYVEGERLPSVRRLHQEWQVSFSTALAALGLLEAQGLIEARPRSGYYVRARSLSLPKIQQQTEPAPAAVERYALISRVLQQSHQPGLMHLGAAVPEPCYLPLDALKRISARCLREQPSLLTDYAFAPGDEELRRQISQRMQLVGCQIDKEDVLITQGCQEALSLCLRALAKPGDIIAIESPAYHGLLQAIEALGLRALEIPCHPQDGLDVEALTRALGQWPVKACVVSANFSNPSGSLMPDEAKARLVALISAAQIPLIEDDTYGDLTHGSRRPRPLKSWDREGWVLYCSAFSKTLAPGFRVGWLVAGRFQATLQRLFTVTALAGHALSQRVIAEYLARGEYDRHLRRIRRSYRQQMQAVGEALAAEHLPVHWQLPRGGFLLWLQLAAAQDAMQVYQRLLEQGVSVMPGHLFSGTEHFQHCLRLSVAVKTPQWPEFARALQQVL
ncbi:aminotransferase-like domain-containing protein [Balneatrix alpica]|uniref:aminotransferase-like domain-containing protein n=1 Tax=Balneatrix alpica TaxID=75684 RepID=UPI0027393DE3|nr:PLP-dependent aminotransferase family protein [Balneatrix alpica]